MVLLSSFPFYCLTLDFMLIFLCMSWDAQIAKYESEESLVQVVKLHLNVFFIF